MASFVGSKSKRECYEHYKELKKAKKAPGSSSSSIRSTGRKKKIRSLKKVSLKASPSESSGPESPVKRRNQSASSIDVDFSGADVDYSRDEEPSIGSLVELEEVRKTCLLNVNS